MSIKGIIISVVSALAGATLIAFGCYRAGLHSANKKLEKQKNQYEEQIEQLKKDYNKECNERTSWQENYCKLAKLSGGKTSLNELKQKLEKEESDLQKRQEELNRAIQEANRATEALTKRREQLGLEENFIQLAGQLKSAMGDLQNKLEVLEQKNIKLNEENAKLSQILLNLACEDGSYTNIRQKTGELEKQIKQLKSKLEELK